MQKLVVLLLLHYNDLIWIKLGTKIMYALNIVIGSNNYRQSYKPLYNFHGADITTECHHHNGWLNRKATCIKHSSICLYRQIRSPLFMIIIITCYHRDKALENT